MEVLLDCAYFLIHTIEVHIFRITTMTGAALQLQTRSYESVPMLDMHYVFQSVFSFSSEDLMDALSSMLSSYLVFSKFFVRNIVIFTLCYRVLLLCNTAKSYGVRINRLPFLCNS